MTPQQMREEEERRRRAGLTGPGTIARTNVQSAPLAPKQGGMASGQAGPQGGGLKNQIMSKAVNFVMGQMFPSFQQGGPVEAAPDLGGLEQVLMQLPPEGKQALQAFLAGELSEKQFAMILHENGVDFEMFRQFLPALQQMKAQAVSQGAPQSPMDQGRPQAFNFGGRVYGSNSSYANTAPLARNYGGPVGQQEMGMSEQDAMMAIPASGPVKSVKKKKKAVKGHNVEEQEMAIEFDTKAISEMPNPPMSEMAKKIFGV